MKRKFGTLEWATHNVNILNGCKNDCKYCYSKEMAIRFKRKNKDNWKFEEKIKTVNDIKLPKETGTIMFPSSHDLSKKYIDEEIEVIKYILTNGKYLLLVSKPNLEVVK